MTSQKQLIAANGGGFTLPANLRTEQARIITEHAADKFLAANDNAPPKGRAPVYRGGRPAFNWAAKQDRYGAACLWMLARQRIPYAEMPANDNRPQGGLDVRRNGVARGPVKTKANLGAHLALPAVIDPLGSADPQPVIPAGHSRIETKPQNQIRNLSPNFRSFASCADAVPDGVEFIGAESGLGTPRPGKSRGSPLKAEEPDFPEPPPELDYVIELILARENLAGIGKAFGSSGRYCDKKGAALITKAMEWAKLQIAESGIRPNITNQVA